MSTPQPDHDSYNIHGKRIMGEKHRLLKRQLGKYLSQEHIDNTPGLADFINSIDESYKNFDKDNKLNGHAFRIAEMEYQEITKKLNSEKETIERGVKRLTNMIRAISPNFDINKISEKDDLLFIADCLEEQVSKRKQVERQLKIAVEREKQASNVKSEFLATISHEIRSPLNVITSLSHILLGEDYLPHQKENLEVLKIASNNLLLLINDVLDFSKIESGNVQLEKASFNLKEVISGVQRTLNLEAAEKQVILNTIIEPQVPELFIGDEGRLRQILLNLINNAIKFTEEGRVDTHISVKQQTPSSCKLLFKVKDTGIGIPEKKLKSIFRSFTQASDETSRKYGGTGLGLTIAKELIELQSGAIDVQSVEGEGSTFTFSIKFALDTNLQAAKPEEAEKYTFRELTTYRFLMAEDNPMNQLLARKVFAKWNCSIDFANNGKLAIAKLSEQAYDLVLMDLQMPEMDGYQATKYIRKELSGAVSDIPIIAITAHALSGESE